MNENTLMNMLLGNLSFKVYNPQTRTWELVKLNVPELLAHIDTIATIDTFGHVQLSNDVNSKSASTVPTSKVVSDLNESMNNHINDEDTHVSVELINRIAELESSNDYLQQKVVDLENYMPEGVHVTTWGGLYGNDE